ncbi:hypothetical protein [Mesorhizobium sp.]|uniref:hypothetical protein n=1 Tax=Mesorhizobium sp. TaxID=1871066 RepID=UPI000FEA591B|nr:hypothetical protein [Mesorhizobium sp.]RWP94186.1 MAG: hypothetical protein EOR89_31400 [Mesorhizobium sp.]RWQ45913.1 MAG: hypothetical protein EOS82_23425 [Mesorhizobium sp.]
MAQPTQYSFSLTEVTKLLLREQGIREGRWALGFDLGFGVGAFGASDAEARPGAMVTITGVSLAKVPEENPTTAVFVVDASKLDG